MNLDFLALIPILAQEAGAAAAPARPGGLMDMVPSFLLMGIVFYFLLIRPQQKRQKEMVAMMGALKAGDKVVTSGGIHGLITSVKEGVVTLKIADNVKIKIDKTQVGRVEKSKAEKPEATDETDSKEGSDDS